MKKQNYLSVLEKSAPSKALRLCPFRRCAKKYGEVQKVLATLFQEGVCDSDMNLFFDRTYCLKLLIVGGTSAVKREKFIPEISDEGTH